VNAPKDLILIADDDEDIVSFVETNLRLEGYETAIASDGEQALHVAYDRLPDLILLDVMVKKVDGYEVCQRLRADTRTRNISIVMLTAGTLSADRVVGLTAGADDYLIKPFDPVELVARVKTALRRSKQMRSINPLTQLPGNVQVQEEVAKHVAASEPFAMMYIDLDHFKPFNDHYGFLRGDEAIKLLARTAGEAINSHGGTTRFLGHVGGDDFIGIVDPDVAEAVAEQILTAWDLHIPDLYDPDDFANGYVEVEDRQKRMHRFPLCTVSIGIASNQERPIHSHWQASEIASEMKSYAKREPRSAYATDRRKQP
jgi:diguanylate cyclase (GGDEF)-like protein